jgi:hypothetical protein
MYQPRLNRATLSVIVTRKTGNHANTVRISEVAPVV